MKEVRDLLLTVGLLLLLISGMAAVPFIIVLLVILGMGFIIYAYLHDQRIDVKEEATHDTESRDNRTE